MVAGLNMLIPRGGRYLFSDPLPEFKCPAFSRETAVIPESASQHAHTLPGNFYHDIRFNNIKLLNLVEALKYKTALEAFLYFLDIVLESFQRSKRTFINQLALTSDTNLTTSLEDAVRDIGSGNIADLGCFKYLTYLCVSDNLLLVNRIKHTLHGRLNIFDCLIDDPIQSHIHSLTFGSCLGGCIGTDIETDNNCIGGTCQGYI